MDILDPPTARTASIGFGSKDSTISAVSFDNVPIEWKPRAKIPANAPGPTPTIKIMAISISGIVLIAFINNLQKIDTGFGEMFSDPKNPKINAKIPAKVVPIIAI